MKPSIEHREDGVYVRRGELALSPCVALGSGGLLTFFSLNILSSSACRAAHTGTDTHLCQDSQTQQLKLYTLYTRYSTSAYRSAAGRWPQADHSRPERMASASLLRHSLAVAENPPLALRPLPPQISLLCSSGAGVASGAQYNGASTARACGSNHVRTEKNRRWF